MNTARGTQPALLLLGMGSQGRPYLAAARRLGLAVVVLDRSTSLRSPKTRRLLDSAVETVGLDEPAGIAHWYTAARAISDVRPLQGVVPFSEEHVVPAAMLADELGLPSPGLRCATTSRNKAAQRAVFAAHDVPQPAWLAPQTEEQAHEWLRERSVAVVKPVDRAGSSGVRLITNPAGLATWFDEEGRPSEYLLEEFVDGPEFSVELLVRNGERVFANLTAKTTTAPPYFVEIGHEAPAHLSAASGAAITAAATKAIRAMGMVTGIAHVELRLDHRGGPRILEAAVRTPGDHIMELVGAAWDANVFELVIRLLCGLPVAVPAKPARHAHVVYVPRAAAQRVDVDRLAVERSCHVVLNTLDAVHHAEVDAGSWRDSSSRGGVVLASAPNRDDVAALRSALLDGGRDLRS